MNIKKYVITQVRFSVGNIPSVPVTFIVLYSLTSGLDVWYLFSWWASWMIGVAINFNIQRSKWLHVVATHGNADYLSKITRFYIGNVPSILVGTWAIHLFTTDWGMWYILSAALSLMITTIVGMVIQVGLKVIKIDDDVPEAQAPS